MSFREKAGETAGKFIKYCAKHNGAFLFATTAAAWVLASTAQTIGLLANKKISKDEKKFLVPQEILDGTFNIAAYAAITLPLMHGAKKAAMSKFRGREKIIEGANTLAAIAGGIISSNIVTPILRNKFSVLVKKKMEEKNITPPPPEIYDGKTCPNFRANGHFNMQKYVNFTKNMPYGGSLKI